MKKLMFAAFAAAATTVLADGITSVNVVGYQDIGLGDGAGNTMAAPTFANVGISGKFNLGDIKMSGYDVSVWNPTKEVYEGGVKKGNLVLQTLTKGGTVDQKYYWVDYLDGEEEGEYDEYRGWFKISGTKYVPMTSAEIAAAEFDQGQTFWIKSTLTKEVNLVPAGAVGTSDISFVLQSSGNTGVGVARPSQLTLGDISASGYDVSVWNPSKEVYEGGVKKGNMVLQTLTKGGVVDQKYYWVDYLDGEEEGEYDEYRGWFKISGTKYVPMTKDELDAVVFAPGTGFWFKSTLTKEGVTLNIPAVELN